MTTSEDVLTPVPVIKHKGSQISDEMYDAIRSIDAESSRGATGWCRLVITDDDLAFVDQPKFAIADSFEVAFSADSTSPKTVFKGEVVAVGVEFDSEFTAQIVVDAFDHAHKLGSNVQIRTFVEQSDSDILSTIAGECGLSLQADSLPQVIPHRFQNGTNQELVEEICRRNGLTWRVDDEMHLIVEAAAPSTGAVTLSWGENLLRLSSRYSASEQQSDVEVRGWDPTAKQAIVGTATPSTGNTASSATVKDSGRSLSGRNVSSVRRVVQSQAEANVIAGGIAKAASATLVAGDGVALGSPNIQAGATLTFANVGNRWSGDYRVTTARHRWSGYEQYTTEFQFGPLEPTALVDVLGATRHSRNGPAFTHGVTVGIVTNNTDPDTVGRVKLKLPYLSDDLESDWVRVTSLGTGPERGILFHPEVDDEVLVAFEHGDLRRPIVVGGLWNGRDALPDAGLIDNGAVQERLIQSRLGHKIRLSDGDGDDTKFVSIELEDGSTKAHFGASKIEIVSSDKTIELKSGNGSVLIDGGSGDITLRGANITIKADQKVTIESGTDLAIKSGTGLKIEAGTTGDLKASAKLGVDGGGMLSLKAGQVSIG